MPLCQPLVGENDECVNAVASVIHRQFDAGQNSDTSLAGTSAKRLEFFGVELVVIRDDGQADARLF